MIIHSGMYFTNVDECVLAQPLVFMLKLSSYQNNPTIQLATTICAVTLITMR